MSYHEVEAFLNEEPFKRPSRREHHLPRPEYARPDAAFFLTLCARHHGEPFRDRTLAAAVIEAISYRSTHKVWIVYAYCLMPDHLHLVAQLLAPEPGRPPRKDLLKVLEEFKSFTTRQAWAVGLEGRLWQHDQYDRLLRSNREFDIRCQYVLDNAVRKGLVEHWTEWPYTGILHDWDDVPPAEP